MSRPDRSHSNLVTPTLKQKVEGIHQLLTNKGHNLEMIETHMSWVFLTETEVYKLKKPVAFDRLDFRELEDRHFFCREELRLNQRLAYETYYKVLPLVWTNWQRFELGGKGETVDWLVHMRRLPTSSQGSHLLEIRQLDLRRFKSALAKLSRFYKTEPAVTLSAEEYLHLLSDKIKTNISHLSQYHLASPSAEQIGGRLLYFLNQYQAIMVRRANHGYIKECHGDLRPEHIFLTDPPQIIDALEFNQKLRTMDCLEELSFLALEMEALGFPELGPLIFESYESNTGDLSKTKVKNFYAAHQAYARAEVALCHLNDIRPPRTAEYWQQKSLRYLSLAEKHIDRCF